MEPDRREPIGVACCQLWPRFGDVAGNRALVRRAVRDAVDRGARLVVLPELCTTGYWFTSPAEAAAVAQPAEGGVLDDWAEEARRADAVVVGGFAETDAAGGRPFNSAAVVDGSGVRAVYRKIHLWDVERDIFQPGTEPAPVVETSVGRVGLAVCYDLYFPELTRSLTLAGADVLALPTNSPRANRRPDPRDYIGVSVARAAAHINRVFVAVCDRHGEERGHQWAGRSLIVDPDGEYLAGPPGDTEATLFAHCRLADARDKRWTNSTNDPLADRRPATYRTEPTGVTPVRA